jgi:peptide/nickel transport system permease protein
MCPLFASKLGWLPSSGTGSWKNYLLPMMTGISIRENPAQHPSYMMEAVRQDFFPHGARQGRRRSGHLEARFYKRLPADLEYHRRVYRLALLGGAVVTDHVFGCNGVGSFIINSVKRKTSTLRDRRHGVFAIIFS